MIKFLGNCWGGHAVDVSLLSESVSVVYDFGVAHDVSFADEVSKYVKRIELFDFPDTLNENRNNKIKRDEIHGNFENEKFIFNYYGVSNFTGELNVSSTGRPCGTILFRSDEKSKLKFHVKKIYDIMKEKGDEEIDILKLDIEGEEYNVLKNILEEEIYPKQITVEFHERFLSEDKKILHTDVLDKLKLVYYCMFEDNYHKLFIRKN